MFTYTYICTYVHVYICIATHVCTYTYAAIISRFSTNVQRFDTQQYTGDMAQKDRAIALRLFIRGTRPLLVCVCVYVCMYVYMCLCALVRMFVCTRVYTHTL